ncbi:MAG: fimbria/pilus periplasmic chaperone [Thermodesulfobacteriota bacterium]
MTEIRCFFIRLRLWGMGSLGFLLTLILASYAAAANFDIKPIKIYLDPQMKIEKLTITNGNEENLTVQIKAYQWTQDEKGQDIYQETKDLIVFPKLATLKKDEVKIIRIGTNLNPGSMEKTYRLFIEEIPNSEKVETKGATVKMYLRIGVPLFFSPFKKEEKGTIQTVRLQKGKAEIKVKNQGNLHLQVSNVQVKGENTQGKEIFSQELGGWYILSGFSKAYEVSIPQEVCTHMTKLHIEVKTNNNIVFKEQIPVEKKMCGQAI